MTNSKIVFILAREYDTINNSYTLISFRLTNIESICVVRDTLDKKYKIKVEFKKQVNYHKTAILNRYDTLDEANEAVAGLMANLDNQQDISVYEFGV